MADTLNTVCAALRVTLTGQEPLPIDVTWVTRETLAQLFADLRFTRGAEIGVEAGRFTETLCIWNKGLEQLFAVDAWSDGARDARRQLLLDAQHAHTVDLQSRWPAVQVVRAFSLDFVREVPLDSLDLYKSTLTTGSMRDIIGWAARVRPGGIVSGHGYMRKRHSCQVPEAVQAYTRAHAIRPWFTVGKEARESRSWLWVKPSVAGERLALASTALPGASTVTFQGRHDRDRLIPPPLVLCVNRDIPKPPDQPVPRPQPGGRWRRPGDE